MASSKTVRNVSDRFDQRYGITVAFLPESPDRATERQADVTRHHSVDAANVNFCRAFQTGHQVVDFAIATREDERHHRVQIVERVKSPFGVKAPSPVVGDDLDSIAHVRAFKMQTP